MTTITINYLPKYKYEITFEGHAQYNIIGYDIVCAAISTIYRILEKMPYSKEIDGGFSIPYSQYLIAIIDTLDELEEQYPNNVKIIKNMYE